MYAYKVKTPYSNSQTQIVIADSYAQAETIFKRKYGWTTTINSIEQIADYVLVQGIDDLPH